MKFNNVLLYIKSESVKVTGFFERIFLLEYSEIDGSELMNLQYVLEEYATYCDYTVEFLIEYASKNNKLCDSMIDIFSLCKKDNKYGCFFGGDKRKSDLLGDEDFESLKLYYEDNFC